MAATYNSKPWQIKIQSQVFGLIRQNSDLFGLRSGDNKQDVRLLDYACGTGMISCALEPYITSTAGIDISPSMVNKFNENLSSVFPEGKASAIEGDILASDLSTDLEKPELYDFDIAAIGLGFHHFADPKLAMQRLVQRVKKGSGVVIIVDWLPELKEHHGEDVHSQGHDHDHGHAHGHGHEAHHHGGPGSNMQGAGATIRTPGFSEEDMRGLFEANGCEDFGFRTWGERVVLFLGEEGRRVEKTVFLARGRRV